MAIVYSEAIKTACKTEREYNKYRSEKTLEACDLGVAVWKANSVWKTLAEEKYWMYREMLWTCKWMKLVINQIDSLKISYYRKEKSIDNAITNKSL